MKCFTDLTFKIKLGLVMIIMLFVLTANTGYCQSPELVEEKILINNMSAPWGFSFINSDEILFTEKRGKVYHFTISTQTLNEISGVPTVSQNGQGGLLDIAIHPNFNTNKYSF